MNADDTELVVAHTSSGAEAPGEEGASGREVVSAFGTVPSEVLFAVYESRRQGPATVALLLRRPIAGARTSPLG